MSSYFDTRVAREAREWIEEITGVNFKHGSETSEDFADSLKDGVILCKCVCGAGGGAASPHPARHVCAAADALPPPPPPPLPSAGWPTS
jgi:hypothetical protein